MIKDTIGQIHQDEAMSTMNSLTVQQFPASIFQLDPPRNPKRPDRFWPIFWLTIILVVAVFASTFTQRDASKLLVDGNGEVFLNREFSAYWEKILSGILEQWGNAFDTQSLAEVQARIDERVDDAFEPVYGQIPTFASFHYSLEGEYTELVAMVTRSIDSRISRILFDEVNFKENLSKAIDGVSVDADATIDEALLHLRHRIQVGMEFDTEDLTLFDSAVALTIEDMQTRFDGFSLTMRGVGASASSVSAGAVMARNVSKRLSQKIGEKVLARTAVKTGGKTGARLLGIGGGGAAGGLFGSFVPVIGTITGAVVGAVVGLITAVATDAVVVNVDEHFNRPAFEAELRSMIDAEKQRIKNDLKSGYEKMMSAVSDNAMDQLHSLRPIDLVSGTPQRF